MPERTKKDHKHGHQPNHAGSRWHNFHFSGKLISCSVIFGFLLILVGGILLAIGMDREEERKSDDYGDLQKKPPLVFVGPAIMGIGGFTVVIGVIMCLVETKVFRRRGGDANPLINGESGESTSRDNETINGGTDPAAIPSNTKYKKHRNSKKSHRKAGNGKKSHSSIEASPSSSQSSEPIGISGKGPRSFLNASDTFLTPPGSFTQDDLQMQNGKRDAVNQTSASLMKSFNSSGTYSTEFQTPSASYIDTPSFPSSPDSVEVPTPQPFLNVPGNLNVKSLENVRHEFLTPQNSNADILETTEKPKEIKPEEENSPVGNRHAFLTPKNSVDWLDESPPIEETLKNSMGNSSNPPDIFMSKKSPDKITTMSVVADVHETSKQHASDVINASLKPLANLSKSQEDVEHSDIKVDVLIDAIGEEVKASTHSTAPDSKDKEMGKSSENTESNFNMVTENAHSMGERVNESSNIIEENELNDKTNGINTHSLELTSGDNTDYLTTNDDLDSRIDGNVDSHDNDDQ